MANPLKMLKLKPVGFQTIQEIPIAAPPKKVWKTVLDVGSWFRFGPEQGPKQTLEAWAGGRWFMREANGTEALFGVVTLIEPEKLLRLSGPIGLSHLPVSNAMIFELQPRKDGKATLLRVGHRAFGFMDADVKSRYAGGWKQLLGNMKKLAEGGK